MVYLASVATLLGVATARTFSPSIEPAQHIFSNAPVHNDDYRIPTARESTAMARKIMHLTTIGDLITTFPGPSNSGDVDVSENRPSDVAGSPIGLLEYYADCDPRSGNPILLAINIATPYKNYADGSNISLSIRWWPKQETRYSIWNNDDDEIPTPHTPAALPRFSLHGRLERLSDDRLADGKIQKCFLRAHPDSIYWQPGNDVHESHYVQLVVDHVYWFGGFGDRARIGWLPMEDWRNLTMREVVEAELPGEEKRRCHKSWWRLWF